MCSTRERPPPAAQGVAEARSSAAASVVLPDAGRAVDAHQPAGAQRGRARPARPPTDVARRPRPRSSPGVPGAAVGRHRVDDLAAGQQVRLWTCSATSPDLACRNHTRSPTSSAGRPGRSSGVCTSPAPSSPVRCRPGGAQGTGERSSPAGPEATRPPPRTVATVGRGPADDAAARRSRRARARTTGSGRTAPGTSSPDPAATSVTAGSATDVSTEPEPPAFQNSSSTTSCSATAISRAAVLQLGHRRGLQPAHDGRAAPLPGHVVGHAGDLALVGHHADQPEPVAAADLLRPARRRRRRRRAASASGPTCAARAAGRRRCRSRPGPAPPEARTESTRSRWADVVDHQRDRRQRAARSRPAGASAARSTVG